MPRLQKSTLETVNLLLVLVLLISIFKNKKIYIYIYLFGYLTLSNSAKQFNINSNLSYSSIKMPYNKIFDNTVPEKTPKKLTDTQQKITPFNIFTKIYCV